jgi:hypothetical protein
VLAATGFNIIVRTEKDNRFMNARHQTAAQVGQSAANLIPENVHLRESSTPGPGENGRIVEVAFKPAVLVFGKVRPSRPGSARTPSGEAVSF